MRFWEDVLGQALDDINKAANRALGENDDRANEARKADEMVVRILKNPSALENQTDTWLATYSLTLESEIKQREGKVESIKKFHEEMFVGGRIVDMLRDSEIEPFQEMIRKRRLLLEHIRVVQEARKLAPQPKVEEPEPKPEPTREERVAACQERIRKMYRDVAVDLERLRADGADEESIVRRENMWADAIRREEDELAKLL